MKLKALMEKRDDLHKQLEDILSKAEMEQRALSEEERAQFDALEKEIKDIDATIEREERARNIKIPAPDNKPAADDEKEKAEERAFASYIRGVVEERADVSLTKTDNGAVIPSSIASKIIAQVRDICPIFERATHYNVPGTLSIPLYDESTQSITMAYSDEFSELESTAGKFTSIELKGFLAGVLTKVSKSLINNSQFDIVSYVVRAMAESVARWIEKELLKGTTGKIEGLSGVTLSQETAASTAITADDLIRLKDKVKDAFQQNAIWIMSPATRTALRLLKDDNGRYLLNDDLNSPFGQVLLGKPVYVTDNMDDIGAGKTVIYYGDMSGLAVKLTESFSVEVLREKYATQHVVGIVGWLEMDAKVEHKQKIAKLVMKS